MPSMRVTYIGHATVLIELDEQTIITDPVLRDRFLVLRRHGRSLTEQPLSLRQVRLVLLSHLHYDHADLPSLRRLPSQATVIVPRGAGAYLASRLPQRVIEIGPGEEVQWDGLLVTATPAAHPGGRPLWGMHVPAQGYMVQGRFTVYFAGDTDLFDEMEEMGRRWHIDLALLPVAGYTPRTPPGHLNPRTAARALGMLRPKLAIPVHWGSLRLMGPVWERLAYLQDPPYTFLGYASQMAADTDVRVLIPGETAEVAGPPAHFAR
jgi:L-ascorbate metabolism protein UlaG (beta-lactamase superfamily)